MSGAEKKVRPPPVISPTLRHPASPTSAAAGGAGPNSPGPRQFTHAPYLATNNIIATEDLNAAEYESMMSRGRRRDGALPGSPTANLTGSYSSAYSGSPTQNGTGGLPSGKKNVCRHFLNGNCNRGSSCRFYHPGSIHRVVTPSHPRTPTQRPLTPLADLAQQNQYPNTSAFANSSPVHSPSLGPSVAMLNLNGGSPSHSRSGPRPVIDNASASDNNSSYVSPLSSPSTSHAQRVPTGILVGPLSASTTPPTLSSPSNGPQVIVGAGSGGGVGARRGPALQPLPTLQLPDCTVHSADNETEDGSSNGHAEVSAMSPPHSPVTPGAHRMPVYRIGVRTSAASSPQQRATGTSLNTSVNHDSNDVSTGAVHHNSSGGHTSIIGDATSASTSVTRNNPYAYPGSPGGVQRQPKEPMSPLKRTSANFQ
uniref:C3H1-type domain-containing protein n=1 Tax=Angomonas deanei TaxID=59799 RepID=C6K3T7_9TRYP|nr:conserved hypothetical protein [Angomonas deanei]